MAASHVLQSLETGVGFGRLLRGAVWAGSSLQSLHCVPLSSHWMLNIKRQIRGAGEMAQR